MLWIWVEVSNGNLEGCLGARKTYSSLVSSACDSRDSMPDRNCSSDLEIWASWALGERLSDMARCRSSKDSLMWSDRRNSCGGLVAIVTIVTIKARRIAEAEVVAAAQ
jgi:hypothetical protein